VTPRVLVAGIGNVLFHDDGFGVAVAEHLRREAGLPGHVVVRDIGIRGLHLAYDLIAGWDLLIVVDAIRTATAAGTLHLIEPSRDVDAPGRAHDAHGMDLRSILMTARLLDAPLPAVLVVGCEVRDVSEGIGLTPDVARAVPGAARMVRFAARDHAPEACARRSGEGAPT